MAVLFDGTPQGPVGNYNGRTDWFSPPFSPTYQAATGLGSQGGLAIVTGGNDRCQIRLNASGRFPDTKYWRFEVRSGDKYQTQSGERCLLIRPTRNPEEPSGIPGAGSPPWGTVRYYGMSFKLDPTFTIPNTGWCLLWQMKMNQMQLSPFIEWNIRTPSTGARAAGGAASPVDLQVRVDGGPVLYNAGTNTWSYDSAYQFRTNQPTTIGDITKDVWYDVILGVKFAKDATGWATVWSKLATASLWAEQAILANSAVGQWLVQDSSEIRNGEFSFGFYRGAANQTHIVSYSGPTVGETFADVADPYEVEEDPLPEDPPVSPPTRNAPTGSRPSGSRPSGSRPSGARPPVAAEHPPPPPPPPTLAIRTGTNDMTNISHPDAYGYFTTHLWHAAAAQTFIGANQAKLLCYRETALHDSTGGLPLTGNDQWSTGQEYWGGTLALVGDTDYQQAWADAVIADVTAAGFDGVQIDDVMNGSVIAASESLDFPAEYPNDAAWETAMGAFSDYVCGRLRGAGLLAVPNIGHAGSEQLWQWQIDRGLVAGAALFEHWMGWANCTAAETFRNADWTWCASFLQGYEAAGVPFFTVTETGDETAGLYAWASFQVLHNFSLGGGWCLWPQNGADPYHAWWDVDLGAPLEDMQTAGTVRSREFVNATVTVDISAGTASVT